MTRRSFQLDPIYSSITRAPTIAGVAYGYWPVILMGNGISIAILHSLPLALIWLVSSYGLSRWLSHHDPFLTSIWLNRITECHLFKWTAVTKKRGYQPW